MPEAKTRRRAAAIREEQPAILGDGMIARIADRAFENPAMSGGLLVMGLTAAAIISNAMFLQSIRHPDPIFPTRVATHAPVAPAVVPIPRSRADHLVAPAQPAAKPAPAAEKTPVVEKVADPAPDAVLVAGLQTALTTKGLYRGPIDGKFGTQTRTAIAAYERGARLAVTGVPSAELLARITAPVAEPAKPAPPVAKVTPPPAPDPAIAKEQARYRSVQKALNNIGYGPVEVDGHAGAETADAIRRFELDNGLPLEGTPNDRVVARLVKIGAMPQF